VFHVLQKFRSTITTITDSKDHNVSLDNTDLESIELDTEIDEDALAQLDGLLQWMDSKIKSATKVRL
jgi:hypothetical protein